ncbi:Threonine-tRNA ligase [Paramicrosporidium saccamoebae]|uniref:Threonine--tRNA ligase, cytoplasmic n=1 Tax=Paramicrosporidium saccamoebae TaxID=1246581 RepID=A0A2H9TLC5_9FUNG|nr:Threonine-tRNA ligase [Paramicrosporidium saccamoebae]
MASELSTQVADMNLKEKKNPMLASGYPLEAPKPGYVQHRIQMFDELKAQYDAWVLQQPVVPIQVTLADGRNVEGNAWKTTPMEVAISLEKALADRLVIAKVNGELWDTGRPLEGNCTLELLDFDNEEGRQVFWHSSAHVLGEACEGHYACHLCLGPPVEDGFYYEMDTAGRAVTQSDYPALETLAKSIVKDRQKFERLEMSKEKLLEMFKHNPFKIHFINDKIPDGTKSTVYRCGPLIDLCRGPHIPHTGRIKAFKVMKNSSSYFLGDANNASLQRIYGVSFPDTLQMKEHLKFLEEADKRDHRKVGKDQQLFFFHELSPGSAFFLPHGTRIHNRLVEFIRSEYRKRGFSEVISPNMFNAALWKTSGHWENYRDDMFTFEVEKEPWALKPMNCPGHCLMFAHRERSYRELPIRFADFGVLHRNELSGALTGLTRVRRFQQDDAHIFCRNDQIKEEINGCISFLESVYGIFGFTFNMKLSTRPEKYLGEVAVWDEAERQLTDALNASGHRWELNPGDGAFYGPKIDITIQDAHRKRHQCATIQLDYQLPTRFNLEYRTGSQGEGDAASDIKQRPVIIHRAVLGSIERMFAILTENFAQNWPFWISPRQIAVVPVSHAYDEYAGEVQTALHSAGFHVDADLSDLTLNKKIRNAEVNHYTFICVVGGKEAETRMINIRKASKDGNDVLLSIDDAIAKFKELDESKTRDNFISI